MCADYEMLMLLSIALSISLYNIVFNLNKTSRFLWEILGCNILFFVLGRLYLELDDNVIMLHVVSFTLVAGFFGGTYESLFKPYVRGKVLKVAYLADIGILSAFITWCLRWAV